MPTPNLPSIGDQPSQRQILDYIAKLQRDLEWLLSNLDDLNVRRITADIIYAGTIDANVVTIRSDLTAGAYVQIDGNGMVINNGSFNTFTADINGQVTMTRALIQSNPSGYPRIVMDPTTNLFGAYQSAANYALINPINSFSSAPAFSSVEGSDEIVLGFGAGTLTRAGLYSSGEFEIRTPVGLNMPVTRFTNWTTVLNMLTGNNLQQDLNAKATSGAATSSVGNHDHGIPAGTLLAVSGGGSVTWVPSGGHFHTQS
jgi:hypothetical protein